MSFPRKRESRKFKFLGLGPRFHGGDRLKNNGLPRIDNDKVQ